MPTVKRFDRCRIEMYFDDHPPPHFHVITRDGEKAAYLIETLECWVGDADSCDVEQALQWAAENRDILRERWQEYSEEES